MLPLAIAHVEGAVVLLARCTLRDDFRMFRLSRIVALGTTAESFAPRRAALLREYLERLERADPG